MALKVIGAGWGRTGTESLKKALEILGYDKCYHMFELMAHAESGKQLDEWEKLERGEKPDYDFLFKGYESAVDFPAAMYYRELMQQYPDAKVILSVRDADKWFDSASATILKGIPRPALIIANLLSPFIPRLRTIKRAMPWISRILYDSPKFFDGRRFDRAFVTQRFNEWNEEVKRTVPAEKLLVFEVKEGWEPLCKFLGVPVPNEPFPKSNEREGFDKKATRLTLRGK